ncbi:hypothetical protein [Nostoc sp. 'Peltigera malacea cyanobiont' DB3992]|uniref:hypothetical protein n=1 Tax=Nostoc sp. 'Peltigera malacea cyanobiont' DB3992 TaxID=1206980 RepID=UPI00211DE368|nr:hypothetical protein [Nostoc sp. 'Peltigera malacea cyanobiont' DB3992]
MQKLTPCSESKAESGFDFLLSCWSDDPAKADCDQEIVGEVSAVGYRLCVWGAGEVELRAMFVKVCKIFKFLRKI